MKNELMKTYHIAICDDDASYIDYATKLFLQLQQPNENFIFYNYLSGEALLNDIEQQEHCDLLFLDVQLTGMDGNATASKFREVFPDSVLVFCSGVYLPTPKSFETIPYRYLLKSYTKEKMKDELSQVCQKMRSQKPSPILIGKKDKKSFRLNCANVEYIEIVKHGSIIHTFENNEAHDYFSNTRVSEYMKTLYDFGFAYAHNSYIVNLNCISIITATEITLTSGISLSVSRSHSKDFRDRFADFLAEKY